MPFEVRSVKGKYKLWKINEKTYAKPTFNTRESAINAGMNYMRYRREQPYVSGNKILSKKKGKKAK